MAGSVEGKTYAYDAFVSYSHAADNELAPVLQSHLQSFAKPWYKLRSLRVFRDATTLTLTPHLWPTIREAMDSSRYFVLLASPKAAQSRWVQQEVSHWLTTRGADTLLILLTEGAIDWNDQTNDFDWSVTTSLPPCLKGAFVSEPKWEDVSSLTTPEDLTMQNPVLRKTVASLYSAITGKPLDAVIGEDVRQYRRTRAIAGGTLAAFLIGAVGIGGYVQYSQAQRDLERQRTQHQREERLRSQSRHIAEQARQLIERGDAGSGANLVLEDLERDPEDPGERPIVSETHMTLFSGLHSNLERNILPVRAQADVVAFSPLGTILVAADRTVQIFDQDTRTPKMRLAHDGKVLTAVFSGDGQRVLTAAKDKKARVFDLVRNETRTFEHSDEVVSAAFDPTEKLVATASRDDTAGIWDVATGQRKALLQHEADVMDVAWAENGTRLVTVTVRGMVRAWDVVSGVELFAAPAGRNVRLTSVSINRDGTRAVTAGLGQGAAVLWNTKNGAVVATLSHGRSSVSSAVFSPTDNLVVTTGRDQRAAVWETENGRLMYTLLDHTNVVAGASFSPDGSRLVTFSPDRTARVYAACDGRELAILRGHTDEIVSAGFSPDGCSLLTGSGDATARHWDLISRPGQTIFAEQRCAPGIGRRSSERCKAQAEFASMRREVLGGAISPDGKLVATASNDRIARVYDSTNGNRLAAMPMQEHPIIAVTFDLTGEILLTGQGPLDAPEKAGALRLWNWREGREIIPNGIAHTGSVRSIAISPDGTRVLTASGDGLAQVFDLKTGVLQLRIETPADCRDKPCQLGNASWSPDGKRIATASFGKKACVWDVVGEAGMLGGVLTAPALCVAHNHIVYAVNWNSVGTHIVTGSGDQTAAVWDARTGQAQRRFFGDDFDFRTVQFFDNDRQVITANGDYSVRFWYAGNGREAARLLHRQAHVTWAGMDKSGQQLFTASADGIARIWRLPPTLDELAASVRGGLKRCLSTQQRGEFNLNYRVLPSWCAGKLHGAGAGIERLVQPGASSASASQ